MSGPSYYQPKFQRFPGGPYFPAAQCESDRLYQQVAYLRLVACHGINRAIDIVNGQDAAANADLSAWRALGGAKTATQDNRS